MNQDETRIQVLTELFHELVLGHGENLLFVTLQPHTN